MGRGVRVLLVEDDAQLGKALLRSLVQAGYETRWARTLAGGDLLLRTQAFEILLLDLGLPDGSGLELLRALRRRQDRTPVLILTAQDSVQDRVRGLDEGADDYQVKPFAVPELLSRIRALVRRSAGFAARRWVMGDLALDPEARTVTLREAPVDLAPREFQVLHLLSLNAGRVVTRAQLEETLFALGAEPESNAIEVHIHHLRRKLGAERIRTVRGLGYLLEGA
ncbi:response regulator [Mesoterricola silvestris]|uniref:DNA-binding response regulator n=1 Tax=Mesoterricola silvestris TaxID=2927979 RepID=A0AA48KB05_9BACT|nr:response regulator [Mesoterricola silvestris]BDU72038.1 DNA-binding response regulator [Mesoterricola silvestris]